MSSISPALLTKRGPGRPRKSPPEPTRGPATIDINLPYNFTLRDYQVPLWRALDNGMKRAVVVWHRRAGKDLTLFNYCIKRAWERVGVYYHLLPTFTQGKRIIWDGVDNAGRKFMDYIPAPLIERKNETELKVAFKNGSLLQIIGTDQFNGVVGPNPVGCVFSEYALQNPKAWDLIRPILTANGGWAAFDFTPRGKNHGFELYNIARTQPARWFSELLTCRDTLKSDGSPVITEEAIKAEIKDGMDPDLVQQEFYCSFNAPQQGSYYGMLMEQARKERRICKISWDPSFPVDTWWDLGIGDSTAIWFTQVVARQIRVIDYLENSGEGLTFYAKELRDRNYVYGRHHMPHDGEARRLGSGKSAKDIAESLGIKPIDIVPNIGVDHGIGAVRAMIPKCWFNEDKCGLGLKALDQYQKKYDEKNKCFKVHPLHDWSSDGADAFRYFAVGFHERVEGLRPQTSAQMEFDVYKHDHQVRPQIDMEFDSFGGNSVRSL